MHGRAAHDVELEAISKATIESARRAVFGRKAKVYEELMKGKSGGLSDKQCDELLVNVRVSFFFRFSFSKIGSLIQKLSTTTSRTAATWTSL